MARFLFTTLFSNDLGLPNRTVPVAGAGKTRGHEVAFCNPEQAPRKLIADADLRNLEFRPRTTPTVLPSSFTQHIWNMDHFYAAYGYQDDDFLRNDFDGIMEIAADYAPDVIVDSWNLAGCLAARAMRKPLVSVIQADMHPSNRGFIWWQEPPDDIPTTVPTVNRLLAEYGLPRIGKTEELHVGDLTLVVGTPETDPLPKGTEATYVGPILWQKAGAKLPDYIVTLSRKKPLIWVYTGTPRYFEPIVTWGDSIVVLRSCIAALAEEEVHVVLTTGYRDLPADPASLPANFHYEAYVPGIAMAERSDLLIHHGGHGACLTGPYTDTPAVIIPTFSERESNARRIAALGAAEVIVPTEDAEAEKHVPVDEVRAKVKQVLSEASFTTNAKRIGQKMRGYGGASEAAGLIENFASRV
ncbi:MAG: hypothetical protein FJ012_02560 [Chloroflexi bacterium]|nr:hypothetical protein [Chloroflexota bacterium]